MTAVCSALFLCQFYHRLCLTGGDGRLQLVFQPGLLQHIDDMIFNGRGLHTKRLGDPAVGKPAHQQAQHAHLGGGKIVPMLCLWWWTPTPTPPRPKSATPSRTAARAVQVPTVMVSAEARARNSTQYRFRCHILFFSTLKVCYLAWYNLVIQSNIYQEGCCHGCKRR